MTDEPRYWRPEPKLWDWAFWSLLAPAAVWVVGVIIYGAQALMAAELKWEGQDIGSLLMVMGGEAGTLFTVMEVFRKSKSDDANGWDWSGIAVSLLSTLGVMLVIFTRQTTLDAKWIDPVRNWGPLVLLLCSALDFYANVIELGYYRASFEERWDRWNELRARDATRKANRVEAALNPPTVEPQPTEPVPLRHASVYDWREIYPTLNGDREELDAARVNAILQSRGFQVKAPSTAAGWASEAKAAREGG